MGHSKFFCIAKSTFCTSPAATTARSMLRSPKYLQTIKENTSNPPAPHGAAPKIQPGNFPARGPNLSPRSGAKLPESLPHPGSTPQRHGTAPGPATRPEGGTGGSPAAVPGAEAREEAGGRLLGGCPEEAARRPQRSPPAPHPPTAALSHFAPFPPARKTTRPNSQSHPPAESRAPRNALLFAAFLRRGPASVATAGIEASDWLRCYLVTFKASACAAPLRRAAFWEHRKCASAGSPPVLPLPASPGCVIVVFPPRAAPPTDQSARREG